MKLWSLKDGWKNCCFYTIKNNGIPSYLAELIPYESHFYNTRNTRNITFLQDRCIQVFFSPLENKRMNKLNFNIQTSSFNIFRANLIKIIRPIPNSIFDIFSPLGLKLITRFQLGLSRLNEHRFNHNFNKSSMHMQPGHWVDSLLFSPLQLIQ